MGKLVFKATRRKSCSYGAYRQIEKEGDLSIDTLRGSDDAIFLNVYGKSTVIIDCDKKTGKFSLFVE